MIIAVVAVLREEPVDDDLQHDDEEAHEHHLAAHEGVGGVALQMSHVISQQDFTIYNDKLSAAIAFLVTSTVDQ